MSEWISVEDRLPEDSRAVLVLQATGYKDNTVLFVGSYARRFELECGDFGEDWGEYCEEKEEYFCPEGWHEHQWNWCDYSSISVSDGKVTHWMELPKKPTVSN